MWNVDIVFEVVDGYPSRVHLMVRSELTYRFLDPVIKDGGVIPPG